MSENLDLSKFTNPKALEIAQKIVNYFKQRAADSSRLVWHVDGKEVYTGTKIEPLIDGEKFGTNLLEAIGKAQKYVFLTAWAIDPSFRLRRLGGRPPADLPSSWSIAGALSERIKLGVAVRVLEYRNALLNIPNPETNFSLETLRAQGIPARATRWVPVLHQKTAVIDGQVGFCGGIDPTRLAGDRWDTHKHLTSDKDSRRQKGAYKDSPWHDVHVRIEGPAVIDIQRNFAERWDESESLVQPDALPDLFGVPPRRGNSAVSVQVIRTIPRRESGFDPNPLLFEGPTRLPRLPRSEEDYSTLESFGRAIVNAQRFIYIENQYFTCTFLVDLMKIRLKTARDLSVVVLLPRTSELAVPEDKASKKEKRKAAFFRFASGEKDDAAAVVASLREAEPERVFVAYLTNESNIDVYVHAKVMIVDDVYATIGSANFSYRGMYRTDQELGVAWVDLTRIIHES